MRDKNGVPDLILPDPGKDTIVEMVLLACEVLFRWEEFHWTTMGFGMIRTYLDAKKQWRFNIWDDRLRVPDVSTIHTHPWSFTSYIIAGEILDSKYMIGKGQATHSISEITTGVAGQTPKILGTCELIPLWRRQYQVGDRYMYDLTEIHETAYRRGTVTLNDRTPPTKDHTAKVFYNLNDPWVDAIPRDAKSEEVEQAVSAALRMMVSSGVARKNE